MKRFCSKFFFLSCLGALPLAAQPVIGGNSCNSASLSGIYAFTLTGRQVTSAGNFTNVLQGNGSANFDGLSKVTITLTTDTLQSVATPLTWSGTYTIQSNCLRRRDHHQRRQRHVESWRLMIKVSISW